MKQLYKTIPLILWCSLIFYFSSQHAISVNNNSVIDITTHKLAHLILYAGVFSCFYYAFNQKFNWKVYLYGLIFCLLYGISDEIHQSFTPSRSPRVYDVVIDVCGGAIAAFIIKIIK